MAHGRLCTQAAPQSGRLTLHRLNAQNGHSTMRTLTLDNSGQETFEKLAIAEVGKRGVSNAVRSCVQSLKLARQAELG